MSAAIVVQELNKSFLVRESERGFKGFIRNIFHPKIREARAVRDLSFVVERGEKIAFIGPNGAGKSTTIKMLCGILSPDSGTISVLGFTPFKDRAELAYRIGTVFGQRSQLSFSIPAIDTFELLKYLYELRDHEYTSRLRELSDIFELKSLLPKMPRQLSLGERTRLEIAASLIHRPNILFLDEPTIGLDLTAKLHIRLLLNRLSKEEGTTLFLTSHDTTDIEQITNRVMVLDKGSLVVDSSLFELKKEYLKKKIVTLTCEEKALPLQLPGVTIVKVEDNKHTYEVDSLVISIERVIHAALKSFHVKDVTIEDPSMEEIIRQIYAIKISR
jgi:ABC-2 type transport system ATP-binding protein